MPTPPLKPRSEQLRDFVNLYLESVEKLAPYGAFTVQSFATARGTEALYLIAAELAELNEHLQDSAVKSSLKR